MQNRQILYRIPSNFVVFYVLSDKFILIVIDAHTVRLNPGFKPTLMLVAKLSETTVKPTQDEAGECD